MLNFTSVKDAGNPELLVQEALRTKQNLFADANMGKNKTLGLVFLNPSLRTRMSSQKAGTNLGMQVQVINAGADAWTWEFQDGVVMDGSTSEHVKEAAQVLSQYCDIIGLRAFPGLKDREYDYSEHVLNSFIRHAKVPAISLESATRHPLQSFADLITIREVWQQRKPPKVVLTWAPHIKPLPQCVPNSFAEWMNAADVDFCIANPPGYDLSQEFTQGAPVFHTQDEALRDADFVYVKNWSSYENYGAMPPVEQSWLLDDAFVKSRPHVRFMHCLPVRRNLEMSDAALDSPNSLINIQAFNRTVAMQTVLKEMLQNIS